jgi:hypothetical protein
VGQRRRTCVRGGYHGDRRPSPPLSRWGPPRPSLEGYTAEPPSAANGGTV